MGHCVISRRFNLVFTFYDLPTRLPELLADSLLKKKAIFD